MGALPKAVDAYVGRSPNPSLLEGHSYCSFCQRFVTRVSSSGVQIFHSYMGSIQDLLIMSTFIIIKYKFPFSFTALRCHPHHSPLRAPAVLK